MEGYARKGQAYEAWLAFGGGPGGATMIEEMRAAVNSALRPALRWAPRKTADGHLRYIGAHG